MSARTDLPRDPVLPQLRLALDSDHMVEVFDRTWRVLPATPRIKGCSIERIKYKPFYNCLICYRLDIDTGGGRVRNQRVCGRIFEAGGALSRFEKALRQPSVSNTSIAGITHIPELEMVVWAFPSDRKLGFLDILTDPDALRGALLPDVLEHGFGEASGCNDSRHRIIHYVPEHTCCVRVDIALERGDAKAGRAITVFGKAYYNDQGAKTWRVMQQLWLAGGNGAGAPITPRPIYYDAAHRILWQEGMPGHPLASMGSDDDLYCATGKAIAGLHGTAVKTDQEITIGGLLARLDDVVGMLTRLCAEHAPRFGRVSQKLRAIPSTCWADRIAVLHGDCHAKNVLVDGRHVTLIDLDNVAVGPALQDVGSFVASLLYQGLIQPTSRRELHRAIVSFLDGYRKHAADAVSEHELSWFVATALINERAYRTVTRLKPGRWPMLHDVFDLADAVVEKGLGACIREETALA